MCPRTQRAHIEHDPANQLIVFNGTTYTNKINDVIKDYKLDHILCTLYTTC